MAMHACLGCIGADLVVTRYSVVRLIALRLQAFLRFPMVQCLPTVYRAVRAKLRHRRCARILEETHVRFATE